MKNQELLLIEAIESLVELQGSALTQIEALLLDGSIRNLKALNLVMNG